jgi:uncharacterized protein YbjT (DUF2867 family)
MSKTIFVTGATGTIGSQLLEDLKQHSVTIKAAIHQQTLLTAPSPQIQTSAFDFENPETYAAALADVESIFLLPPSTPQGPTLLNPFLEYVAHNNAHLNHIVAISVMGITPGDGTAYGAMEAQLQTLGIPYTILRLNWLMQNFNTHYGAAIAKHRLLALPAGEASTSFVDARDVSAVAAHILVKELHQWEALTLTGWEALNYNQVVATLSETLGTPVTYSALRDDAIRIAMQHQKWPVEQIEAMLDLFQRVREGRHCSLSQDVARVLGRSPSTFKQYTLDYSTAWK